MNKREFMQAITGGTAIAGLPQVKSAEVLRVAKGDIVVLKAHRATMEQLCMLREQAEKYFPDIRWLVINGAELDIEVIRKEG